MIRIFLIILLVSSISGCKTFQKKTLIKGHYLTSADLQENVSDNKNTKVVEVKKSLDVQPSNQVPLQQEIIKKEPDKNVAENLDARWYVRNIDNLYEVKKGDSLWKIARRKDIYNNPYMWIKIYTANRDVLKNSNNIYPGQILLIPPERKGS